MRVLQLKDLKSVHSSVDSDEPVMEKEKSSKQGRKIADIDADVEFNLEKAQAEAYNLDLDHQEKVLSMLDVNDEEPADVEEVLEVVKDAKLITKVVTTAGVDVNAASLDKKVTRQLEAELNAGINWNAVIEQFKRSERLSDAVMKYQDLKRKPLTEAQARRNMIVYLKNIVGYKMDYFKGMSYDEIKPFFEKHYNYNQAFLNEVNEEVKVPEKEIVPDDDDVYTDATPLALKILIIDYKIHTKRNRPHFKIIRADGNHRLFLSFSTMLKNFDREDLESLWNIIRERFAKTEPNNYSDDFLLNTLKIMFENPNVEANVMYPLTHFTLEQMVIEVRLEVEDESEMSLELLSLVRRQLNEGLYQQYDIPSSSEQDDDLLFERQIDLLNQTQQMHKELKGTSSSFIDYTPKSTTSSTSPSTNGYLNSPTSPPLRIPPPPPTQENASIDIILTLSPITPLDVQFNTPSTSPPIFGHPIP
nr:hypothetical protein [Tanacetum cinerariifolium]